ncbi:MAG: hypothetical protein PSU94_01060 [Lacunisphaera sp.]|nr:hypothetical protein [Lacunisphaera sp.]
MTLLLAHFSLLTLLSYATARRLAQNLADRIVATALLFWGNIVALCLLLSGFGQLGATVWFFRGSVLLAAATFLLTWRFAGRGSAPAVEPATCGDNQRSRPLIIAAGATLLPIFLGNLAIAWTYEPNNYDSLTYHLPRVIYYLGHGSLSHFETADFRQVNYPFNFNLLQLLCFIYDAPPQAINFLNVASWVVTGFGVHRVARWAGCSFNASLITAWLTLTSTEVLAQATSTILDLPAGAALVAALLFALRWRESRRTSDALLAGLAASLSAGTKLTVVFFGPAAVLLLVVMAYQHWRRQDTKPFLTGVRAWIGPAALAGILSAPFLIFNLRATGQLMTHRMDFTLNRPFSLGCALQTAQGYLVQIFCDPIARFTFDPDQVNALNLWFSRHVFANWNEAYAFSPLSTILPGANEDHVFFGFAGPLFLICGILCLWRDRTLQRPMSWIALLGLGWFAAYFALNKWSSYNQRYFVPPFVLLGPCAAAVLEGGRSGLRILGPGKRIAFYAVAGCALWFAVHYLLWNTMRPVPFTGVTQPKIIPNLPPTLVERLSGQARINFSSYGTNERIYPLMHLGPHQQITSGSEINPANYSVFSFWGATRNTIYSNLAYYSSYTVVPVPAKRTAGVEFLGIMPGNNDTFDYLGLPPHADDQPATPQNSNLAMIVEYNTDTNDPVRLGEGRIRIVGLNPRDAAHARISAELADGTRLLVLNVAHSDWNKVALKQPFKRLVLEVVADADGRSLGLGEMPFTVRHSEAESVPLSNPTSVFTVDFIAREPEHNLSVSGLAVLEGPYPQWDLPLFRWAKQPAVRITVPADARLKELQLTCSVRLQMREQAILDVRHNGELVQSFKLSGRTDWHTEVVKVTARPGENVFELKDHSGTAAPDWLAYLEKNPDVKQYVIAQGQPLEEGARLHYESHGRAEGRALPMTANSASSPIPPDSLYYIYRRLRVEGLANP